MRHGLFYVLVSATFCSLSVQRCLYAQPVPSKTAPVADLVSKETPVKQADDEVTEEKPEKLYMRNEKTGKLDLVLPGYTPDELRRLFEELHSPAKLKNHRLR